MRQPPRSLWVPPRCTLSSLGCNHCPAFISTTPWFFRLLFLLQGFLASGLTAEPVWTVHRETRVVAVSCDFSGSTASAAHPEAARPRPLSTLPLSCCPQLTVSCGWEFRMLLIWGCGRVSCDGQDFPWVQSWEWNCGSQGNTGPSRAPTLPHTGSDLWRFLPF